MKQPIKKLHRSALPAAIGALMGCAFMASQSTIAAPSESYNWSNVRIDGGGFVPGIIFNQKEANLIYARTDIGGAYRWDATNNSWVPLLDWVGWDNWNWNGVLSMATDPVDTNRVYAAVGMYTNSWDPNNGAILRSSDKGKTWQATVLPFKVGGNMPGRGMGERLAIDPNKNSVVYFGAEGGNGLWRSIDYGATWSKVSNFTNVGNYAQDPNDVNDYLNKNQGVIWVTFDPASGTAGTGSNTIYVGVADKENSVYRTTNAGATWERIPGQPTGFLPHKGVYDHANGILYISTSDTGGPYDGAKGDVWKFTASTGTWTNISPIPSSSSDLYFGYSGLTIDRKNPQTLMVASQVSWWPDAIFFRTTDGGTTWTRIWDWAGYPSRSLRYLIDIAEVPWLNFGITSSSDPAVPTVKLGWMNESVEIDPHNSNRLMYGTGATIYGTENLTTWDTGGQVLIKPMVKGLEETAILDLVSPPVGAPVYSAMYDVGGFKHDDLTKVPTSMYTNPNFGGNSSIDYAELKPATMVRVGFATNSTGGIAISTNAGGSWWQGQTPGGATSGGNVAVSADGSTIVWAPGGATGVFVSTTFGSTWTAIPALPAGATIEADRVNPSKFYALSGSTFYISTDKGATFTASAASNLPAARKFKAVYGYEGDIWLAGGSKTTAYGLWHSTDSGATFSQFANVEEADNVTFGKAAPGQTYPTVFIIGKVDGVRGVFRSINQGASWTRINDDQHQYGNFGDAISGDPRVYGRLYLGTNGRGLLYGDSAGVINSSSSIALSSSSVSSSLGGSSVSSSLVSSSISSSISSVTSSSRSSSSVSLPSSSKSSSSSSAVSSSTSSSCTASVDQCSWYGTLYPVCVTTQSGWGWEDQKSCIARSTCNTQPAPFGVVSACGTTSSVASSALSSIASSSKSSVISSIASSVASSKSSSVASSIASSVSSTGSNVTAVVKITSDWNSGYCASVTVTNNGANTVIWAASTTITGTLNNIWGASATQSGNTLALKGLAWNAELQSGKAIADIGFCANK